MKKILLSLAFFTITPMVLFLSIIFLSFFTYQKTGLPVIGHVSNSVAFAALPSGDTVLEDQLSSKDVRTESLRLFLQKNKSPLEPYSTNLIDSANKYGIDYRLLPAIAMQESNLCKKAPKDSH